MGWEPRPAGRRQGRHATERDTYEGSFNEIRIHVASQLEIEVSVAADDGSSGTGKVTTDAKGRGTVDVRLATR